MSRERLAAAFKALHEQHVLAERSDLAEDGDRGAQSRGSLAVALGATRRSARRRRLAATGSGVVAAAAVLAFVVPTAVGQLTADPSPTPSPSVGFTAEPTLTVATFPLDGGPQYQDPFHVDACGSPVPDVTESELFAYDFNELTTTADGGWSGPLVGFLNYQGQDTPVVTTSGLTWLIARDGVVVGEYYSGWWDADVAVSPEQPDVTSGSIEASSVPWASCPDEETGLYSRLEPGEYEVVAITRVWLTPESVALSQLPTYLAVVPDERDGVWEPGSFDCKLAAAQGALPRVCLPDVLPQATVDLAAGTVSLPYDSSTLGTEIDETLVSQRFPLTITEAAVEDQGDPPPEPWLSVEEVPLQCGAELDYVNSYAGRDPLTGSLPRVELAYDDGAANPTQTVDFDTRVMPWSVLDTASVTVENGRMWFFSVPETFGGTSAADRYVVVGSAPVSIAAPFEVDRFVGPTSTVLTRGPIEWCPGASEEFTQSLVTATWFITGADGSVTRTDAFSSPDDAWFAYVDQG